jgi:TrmH family RNA methyltransferase
MSSYPQSKRRDKRITIKRPRRSAERSRTGDWKEQSAGEIISRFAVAIVEPEFGKNLGYLARAMANFGLKKLIVVTPNRKIDDLLLIEAKLYASHGRYLIDDISYANSLDKLKSKFKLLIGTTAIEARRKSNLNRRTLDPIECASKVVPRIAFQNTCACIVFGRDTTGLTNTELQKCDYGVTIRTGTAYNTLNISHAAAIVFYVFSEQLRMLRGSPNFSSRRHAPGPSSRKEREHAIMLFERLAEDAEFKKFKSGLLNEALTRMFNRGDPSLREIYLLMGLASKASSKIRRLSSELS